MQQIRQWNLGTSCINIDVKNEKQETIGLMRPLTSRELNEEDILTQLTEWRNRNGEMFFTQFLATVERTQMWLQELTFYSSDRMMFLVFEKSNLVGQVGFKDFTGQSLVVDGGMKGNPSHDPKIMVYAHKSLMKWLYNQTQVKIMIGWVMASNVGGVMMNRQIGWDRWEKYPLKSVVTQDFRRYVLGQKHELSPTEQYCYKLTSFCN